MHERSEKAQHTCKRAIQREGSEGTLKAGSGGEMSGANVEELGYSREVTILALKVTVGSSEWLQRRADLSAKFYVWCLQSTITTHLYQNWKER